MSESSFDYRFYFKTKERAVAVNKAVQQCQNQQETAEKLGLFRCLEEDDEYLVNIHLNSQFLSISLSARAGTDVNHRLVRASKELGSEFCIVDIFNDQVGEGWKLHLFRGQEVNKQERQALLKKYRPYEPVKQAIATENLVALNHFLNKGLDVNQRIEGHSLLEIAFQHRTLKSFKFLLKHKADVDLATLNEPSLLFFAVKTAEPNDAEFIQLLIQMGADLSQKDQHGANALWYLGSVSQPLQRRLINKKLPFIRPENTYSSDKAIDNFAVAVEHGDQTKIAEYFKSSARDKDQWLHLAELCLEFNALSPLDVLLKNGLLANDDSGETLKQLMVDSLYGRSLEGYKKLRALASNKGLELADEAEDILTSLLAKNNADEEIDHLLRSYPSALTVDTFRTAIAEKNPSYLQQLLTHKKPFAEFFAQYEMPLLHYCVEDLTVNTLEILITAGANIDDQYDEKSLLSYCINDDETDIAIKLYLLENSKQLTIAERIFYQLELNDINGFKASWQQLSDVNITNKYGDSLLMAACRLPKTDIAQFILTQQINIHQVNASGQSALSVAIDFNAPDLVEALLKAGANANATFQTGSDDQSEDDDIPDDMESELEDEEDDDEEIEAGFAKLLGIDALLDDQFSDALDNAKELASDATCLMFAASKGYDAICQLLIKNGADINQQDESNQNALIYAILHNQNRCTALLLKAASAQTIPEAELTNLINMAAMGCNAYAIRRLVDLGADPDSQSDDALTPLILATIYSEYNARYDAADALIVAGAKLGKTNSEGKTPLIYACQENNEYLIAKYLDKGGYPDHVDKEAKTAYDHYKENAVEPDSFNLEDLKPKSRQVVADKLFVKAKTLILKKVIPVYILASIIAIFSQSLAVKVLIAAVIMFSIKPLWALVARLRKTKPSKTNMIERGLLAMSNAMESNQKKQRNNQAIIDSWND